MVWNAIYGRHSSNTGIECMIEACTVNVFLCTGGGDMNRCRHHGLAPSLQPLTVSRSVLHGKLGDSSPIMLESSCIRPNYRRGHAPNSGVAHDLYLFAKRPLRLVRGRWKRKLHALDMYAFPTLSWGVGCQHWAIPELRQFSSVQLSMLRRILGWWPEHEEEWAVSAKRTARHAESLWGEASMAP